LVYGILSGILGLTLYGDIECGILCGVGTIFISIPCIGIIGEIEML
jgi:hypothetical protein